MKQLSIIATITLSLLLGLALWSVGRGAKVRAALAIPALPVTTLTVTNTNYVGAGLLRRAIADAQPGDTINFLLSG